MEKIEGVRVSVAPKGQAATLPMEANGYIGDVQSECVLSLRALVAPEKKDRIFGLNVDGKKNVVLKKNLNPDLDGPAIYQAGIQVKYGDSGKVFHTEYPNNHLRLLVLGEAGNVQIWEVAIISQNGRFFVTRQKTWDTYCYNNSGRLVCPLFEGTKGWPQMTSLLNELMGGKFNELPPLSQKRTEDVNRNSTKVFAENHGFVVWFNLAQMMGVIKTTEGPARAHWTDIVRNNGGPVAHLKPGEFVSYTGLVPPRLTKGRGTTLKFDAVGIKPLG